MIAEHFPLGRIAPYSVSMLECLDQDPEKNKPFCHKEFEALLGKPAKTIDEIYNKDAAPLVGREAPFNKHIKLIFDEIINNPRKGGWLIAGAIRSLPYWSISLMNNTNKKA